MLFCQIILKLVRDEQIEYIQIVADAVSGIIKLNEYKSSSHKTIQMFVDMFARHKIHVDPRILQSKAREVVENYELEKATYMFNAIM